MDVKIIPSKLKGEINAIPSKSYAQRTLIAAALCKTPTQIYMDNISSDIQSSFKAIKSIGADVKIGNGFYTVYPIVKKKNLIVDCGESATTARIMLPVTAALYDEAIITGKDSLKARPFQELCRSMSLNGTDFYSESIPIKYKGKLKAGKYYINASETSQYVSGLLYALPLLKGKSEIIITSKMQSSGYIDMTKNIQRKFGISSTLESSEEQKYISPSKIRVEGDWSNAAFWLDAGVKVLGLNKYSLQKDKIFNQVKNLCSINLKDIPDLAPILAVHASVSGKKVELYNTKRLKLKESNRVESISHMINNLGGKIEILDNSIIIYGKYKLEGGIVDSFNDHRIVMSAAIASCFCDNEVIIKNAEAVNKSYKNFFRDFKMLGGKVCVL